MIYQNIPASPYDQAASAVEAIIRTEKKSGFSGDYFTLKGEFDVEIHEILSPALRAVKDSDLPRLMLLAIGYGHMTAIETIWSERGPFKIELQNTPGSNSPFLLNGAPFKSEMNGDELFCRVGRAGYMKVLKAIEKLNIKGLLDKEDNGCVFFHLGNHSSILRESSKRSSFDGDLPRLNEKGLSNPEILYALRDSLYPKFMDNAFGEVLCWVSKGMVERHPSDLKPFKKSHLVMEMGADGISTTSLSKWSARLSDGEEYKAPYSIIISSVIEENARKGNLLLKSMGNAFAKHGFCEDEKGFVLCQTTATFLGEFRCEHDAEAENMDKALAFASGYIPLGIAYLELSKNAEMLDSEPTGLVSKDNHSQLLWGLGQDDSISKKIAKLLPPEQFKLIAQNSVIDLDLFEVLNRQLGIENSGMTIKFTPGTETQLHARGFKFSAGTKAFNPPMLDGPVKDETLLDIQELVELPKSKFVANQKLPRIRQSYSNLLDMGVWPSVKHEQPQSLLKALEQIESKVDFKTSLLEHDILIRAYLQHAGLEACLKVVETEDQWIRLVESFGADAMAPYVEQMPVASRGAVFVDELGI